MKNTRKAVIILIIMSILAVNFTGVGAWKSWRRYDNVIILVPDGCSQSIQTASRLYKGEPLVLDDMVTGTVSTSMANSLITGSAAAATAFATGHKTTVRFLGIGPRTDDLLPGFIPTAEPYAPVASVLEAANLKGKAVGLISTSRITHATPAAYACHIQDRGWDNDIMENIVYEDVDVVFGGGFRHLIPQGETYTTSFGDSWGGKRTDGQNLYEVLLSRGYSVVDSKDQMDAVTNGKVWGLFDDSHLDPEMDREMLHPTQPSLAEMTEKAIELLSKDKDGFFLMVEGSQVDWAGHNNDPIYMITDFLEFDETVQVAVDYANNNRRTLVLVFPDHNTGGMTIGNYGPIGGDYTTLTYEDLIGPLEGMTMTSGALQEMIPLPVSITGLKDTISAYWGIDITDDQAQDILDLSEIKPLNYAIAHIISHEYTAFGWTTFGHTGEDVPLWAYSKYKFNLPVGLYDNTELAKIVADAYRVSLEDTQEELFIKLGDVLDNDEWSVDDTTEGPVISIKVDEGTATINAGTDVFTDPDGVDIYLKGIVVYAPETGEVYVPEDCLNLIDDLDSDD
jgi:alkaline phosphatase